MANTQRKRLHYAWVIFCVCTLIAFALVGLCNNTRGMYLQPVSEGLHVTRTQYSVIIFISNLISAGISFFLGKIRKHAGLRTLILIGVGSAVAGNVIFMTTSRFAVFLIGEVLMGVAMGCSSMAVISLAIRTWFKNRHGTILGGLYMATGVGSVLLAPVVGDLIENQGYQRAYGFHAVVMLAVFIAALLTLRESPASIGLEPLRFREKDGAPAQGGEDAGLMLGQAVRTGRFWMMLLLGFMVGFGIQAVQGTYSAHIGSDLGYGTVFAASVVSALYVVNTLAKVPLGMMIDKIGVRVVMVICSVMMGCGATVLLLMGTQTPALAYLFGFCHGIGNIMFTVPCPLIAIRIFGTRDGATMTGIFMASSSLGTATAAPVSNLIYGAVGSYRPVYLAMAILFIFAVIFSITVIRPAYSEESSRTAGQPLNN